MRQRAAVVGGRSRQVRRLQAADNVCSDAHSCVRPSYLHGNHILLHTDEEATKKHAECLPRSHGLRAELRKGSYILQLSKYSRAIYSRRMLVVPLQSLRVAFSP